MFGRFKIRFDIFLKIIDIKRWCWTVKTDKYLHSLTLSNNNCVGKNFNEHYRHYYEKLSEKTRTQQNWSNSLKRKAVEDMFVTHNIKILILSWNMVTSKI